MVRITPPKLEKYYRRLLDPRATFNEKIMAFKVAKIKAINIVNRYNLVYRDTRIPQYKEILEKMNDVKTEIENINETEDYQKLGELLIQLESLAEDMNAISKAFEKEKEKA